MLRDDPNLPFLDMAWSPPRMREFFNRIVIPRFCPGREVDAVAIEGMTYKPGRQCVILYAIRFADPQGDPCRLAVVTFGKDDKLQKVYPHCSSDDSARGGIGFGSGAFVTAYRCLVEFFPIDWRLPCLAQAMNNDAAALLLSQVGAAVRGPSSRWQAKVLRYRPHERCVVRYELGSMEGRSSEDVIGKFYPQGPKAPRAWHAQRSLYAQVTENVVIPKPLGLANGRNLVLMECVHGTPMKELLEKSATGLGQVKEATRLIARALVALHRMSCQSEEVRTVGSQVQLFRDRAADLHLVAPRLADQVDALLDRIATIALRFRSETLSCIHGECKASQFLISHGQIAIVDFDRVCLGDPAVDIGNFMANLHREAVQGHEHFRDLASHFLAEYQERLSGKDLVKRTRVFQAASLVRMAVRAFTKTPHAYGCAVPDSLPVRLLREATACLASV